MKWDADFIIALRSKQVQCSQYVNVVNCFLYRRDLQRGNTSANGEEEEANRQGQEGDDDSVEVTPLMVVAFVVLICGTLLLLYYFYDYLVYVVIVLFCLASCNGLYECLHPIVLWLPLGMCRLLSVAFYVINNRSYENVSRQFSQKKNCQGVPPYFKPQIQSCPWVVSYSTTTNFWFIGGSVATYPLWSSFIGIANKSKSTDWKKMYVYCSSTLSKWAPL